MEHTSGENNPDVLSTSQAEWLESVQDSFDALRDPEMDRVIAEAKAANEMLKIVMSTKRQRTEILADLDAKWARWYNEPVKVSGKVSYDVTFEGKTETRQAILWETRVISNGFNIGLTAKDTTSTDGQGLAEVVYQFQVPVDSLPERFQNRAFIDVQVPLDEVVVDSTFASKERAFTWLSAVHPEFIQQVDELIGDSMSEVEALQALADLQFNDIDLDDELTRNCIEAYVRSQVIVDKKMPYGLILDGELSYDNKRIGRAIYHDVTDLKTIAKLSSLGLVRNHKAGQPEQWRLGVKAKTRPQDRREKGMTYHIPLSTTKTIVSLREEFYRD
jgi:hypothetical protein